MITCEERRLSIWTREGVECEPDKPAHALDLAEGIAGQVLGVILFGLRGKKLSLDPLLYLHRRPTAHVKTVMQAVYRLGSECAWRYRVIESANNFVQVMLHAFNATTLTVFPNEHIASHFSQRECDISASRINANMTLRLGREASFCRQLQGPHMEGLTRCFTCTEAARHFIHRTFRKQQTQLPTL